MQEGVITALEYEKNTYQLYQNWAKIRKNPESMEVVWGDPNRTWTSFSIDYMPYLLKIEVPVYVGFGTGDLIAENCDLLPLAFTDAGKRNLTLKPYANVDHNFFELEAGKPNYEKPYWDRVMRMVCRWISQWDRVPTREE